MRHKSQEKKIRAGIISPDYFESKTLDIARKLIGKFLVCKTGKNRIAGMITEVEAYVGPNDRASHASRGKTPRTEVMFGKAGNWYVYLIYGMHYCLNIVTGPEEYPAAILIRSVIPAQSYSNVLKNIRIRKSVNGPGRVCRYFGIDKSFNKEPANKKTGLWIEDRGIKINPRVIRRGKRIGVDYAGRWKDKKWRFYLFGNPVSK